jgi:hypothetical protein
MADPRNTIGSGAPPALRPIAPIRSEAARAAQRAFFEAALGKAGVAPPTTVVAKAPAAAQVLATAPTSAARPASAVTSLANVFGARPSTQTAPATETPPSRPLRPGSIVDIKV